MGDAVGCWPGHRMCHSFKGSTTVQSHREGRGAGDIEHSERVVQRWVLKAEHLLVGLREEEQKLLHEQQEGGLPLHDALQHCWRGQGSVRYLQWHHCQLADTCLEDYLCSLWVSLQPPTQGYLH